MALLWNRGKAIKLLYSFFYEEKTRNEFVSIQKKMIWVTIFSKICFKILLLTYRWPYYGNGEFPWKFLYYMLRHCFSQCVRVGVTFLKKKNHINDNKKHKRNPTYQQFILQKLDSICWQCFNTINYALWVVRWWINHFIHFFFIRITVGCWNVYDTLKLLNCCYCCS